MVGLVVAALCILLNGFFVAAEFAMVKVRVTSLRARARRGDPRAKLAQSVVSRLDRYLSVTQFGITLASLGLGWIGEPALARIGDSLAEGLTGRAMGRAAHAGIDAVAFGILTFAHVLLGELVPKLVAIQRSEGTAVAAAGPLRLIYLTFAPILFALERTSRVVLRAMGMSPDVAGEGKLSSDEIIGILAAQAAQSPQGKAKSELLERVMRFAERAARHSMVPRVDVVSLPIATNGEVAREYLVTHQYSRVLLTRGRSLDDVAGYLYAKDFMLHPDARQLPDLSTLRREVVFVAETQSAIDVLRDMQKKHVPIAVVVDEYGGTSGIVTMEDLLEEIVGEIRDEFDEEPQRVIRVHGEKEAWDVDGRATMDELRAIGVEAGADEAGEPVGALVVEQLGRLPRAGDKVTIAKGATAEVTGISRRRVTRVRVRVSKEAADAPVT